MENFTPLASALGGVLIGLSSIGMLLLVGRIAGISGIVGGLLSRTPGDFGWRLAFAGGLLAGGLVMGLLEPQLFAFTVDRSLGAIAVAGVLVGFGTRLGSGCTSGHGICGMSRFSSRSIVATLTFMATGAITVFVVRQFGAVS